MRDKGLLDSVQKSTDRQIVSKQTQTVLVKSSTPNGTKTKSKISSSTGNYLSLPF